MKVNSWVTFVKKYAADNNMKYNEAMKDEKCKAAYKKGAGYTDILKSVAKSGAKKTVEYGADYLNKKIDGLGNKKKLGKGLFGDVGSALGGLGSTFLTANPIAGVVGSYAGKSIGNQLDGVLGTGKPKKNRESVVYMSGGSLYNA